MRSMQLDVRVRLAAMGAGIVVVCAGAPASAAPPAAGTSGAAAGAPAAGSAAGEEASTRFKRGLQLFDEGDYTLALVEFERAYQLAPNYRALYNIALVDMQLGRYADAARTFEQYLHDGGTSIPPTRRAEVTKTLGELKYRTATLDLSLNVPSAEVTLDGKPVDPARLRGPMVIDAGEHTVRATAPGFLASDKTVTLAGGDKASVRLELVAFTQPHQPGETPSHGRPIFWPGFVATGALAVGAIASGVVMINAQSRLDTLKNTVNSDSGQRTNAANTQNVAALTADILTGLAVVAGGVSLYLTLGPDHSPKSPSLGVGLQHVVLSGAF